eukprot:jgi/Tetstr1/448124/TSEL_035418.t1
MPPNDLLDSAIHTLATCSHACEDRLTYLNRSKCKKVPTIEERVKERHVYNRFFERSSDGVHGILNAADDKQLEVILHEAAQAQPTAHVKDSCDPGSDRMRNRARRRWQDVGASEQVLWIFFKHICPRPRFYHGTSMQDATLAQLTFLEVELARLVASGIAEQDHYYFTVDVRRGHLFRLPDLPIC